MKKSTNVKNILIVAIIFNIIAISGYVFAFYIVKEKSKEASVATNDLEVYRTKSANLSTVQYAVDRTREDREKLEKYFISKDEIISFIERIEALGADAKVELKISGIEEVDQNTLRFNFSTKGTFVDTMHLVSLVEHLPLKIEFRTANIRASGNTNLGSGGTKVLDSVWDGNFVAEVLSFVGEQK